MTYEQPSVMIVSKDLIEEAISVYEVACHCASGGSRVCYGAGSEPVLG